MISLNSVIKFLSENNKNKKINDYESIPKFELKKDAMKILESIESKSNDSKNIDSKNIDSNYKEKIINNELINNNSIGNNDFKRVLIKSLPETFKIIFNNDIDKYYIENKISRNYKNKTSIFTYINSLFMIVYGQYILYTDSEKESNIKSFLKKISDELFEKELYQKFGYNVNRKMNKSNLQEILAKSFTFKYDEGLFPLLQQYIVDYFGINVFVLCLVNNNIDFINSYYILSSYYKIKTNPLLPTIILVKDNDIFKPLLDNNEEENIDTNCFLYSKNKNIIESLWKYFKLDEIEICIEELKDDKNGTEETFNNLDLSKLKKLKVDELKEICIKYEISLTKMSDKTSKMINKTKTELIDDIEAYIKK
jgi:hypothetical protein